MNELAFNSDAEEANPALAWLDGVSVAGLSGPELRGLAAVLGRIKNKADSVLCEVAAAVTQNGAGEAAAEVLQDSVRMSGREARRVARVAGQLVSMPNTAERLASGDITMEPCDGSGQRGRAMRRRCRRRRRGPAGPGR